MRLLLAAALLATAAAPALAARPVEFAGQAPQAGALVLPLGSAADLGARGAMLDAGTRTTVERALTTAEFDYETGSTLALRGLGPWSQILVVGAGTDTVTVAEHHEIGGIAARETAGVDGPVALAAAGLDAAELAVGAGLGGYRFDKYKFADPAKPRARGLDAPFTILTPQAPDGVRSRALVEAVHFTRDLINEPANIVYPESFVERTRAAFRGVPNVTIEVLDVPAMERLGMGSILSVGKGSARPPRMLIVRYRGADAAPVVLAGKGITFDSGGISLKPGAGMWEMKGDMSGAAAVTGAVLSLAKSRAPVHAISIAALAENMPGGSATRPGDIVKAYNGKTIEILNTDAEGRLVLADAVAYAERQLKPAAIVDVATLTGSKVTAVSDEYAALFSWNDALAAQLAAAGETSGELLWRLPLNKKWAGEMKSKWADIKNVVEGGSPGASYGAHFIGSFVDGGTPWAHLDIAGSELADSAHATGPAGAIGFGVRLLDRFVRDFRPVPAAAPAQL